MTATETELERTVREEQEAHDAAETEIHEVDVEDANVDDDGQTAAFDRSQYEREDLQIPKIDGETIDKIQVKFTGKVLLDRSDPADVALINRMKLGHEVELRCSGTVSSVGAGFTTNKQGDLDVVVAQKTLKVDSVWVLTPEQLG